MTLDTKHPSTEIPNTRTLKQPMYRETTKDLTKVTN